jgi:transcriptional regulator with XRE-family HTH domain
MRLEEAPTFETVLAGQFQDPEFRAEWERTALARAVANAVVRYRTERGLGQRALAGLLGWKQPQVARLEFGDHNPTMETLLVLTRKLRLRFAFAVGRPGHPLPVRPRKTDLVERVEDDEGWLLAAAG